MTITTFAEACAAMSEVDESWARAADELSDRLTKPRGALGRVEELGRRLSAIARACPPPVPDPVTVCVFAADHGVVARGVTPWPQEVTAQMVANFTSGGAAINVLARQVGARVLVVDVGVATALSGSPGLVARNVRPGTADLSQGPAMTAEEAGAALDVGASVAADAVAEGARLLVGGDMGIGNTTASAAVIAALTGRPAAAVTGRGTGVDDATLAHKTRIVEEAVSRLGAAPDPLTVLTEVGGLEIAALAGAMAGAAALGVPFVVDGVVGCAAALVGAGLAPATLGYLIAGHRSVEPGAGAALEHLGLRPLLDLGLRLGEGTGAVLAVPVVQSAARILGEMATFDAAGVTDKDGPAR
jgi:nicotinate-nucleotide--dimethylbenzimidazole phosphoribosyltransferase